jgi:hypothetical protein
MHLVGVAVEQLGKRLGLVQGTPDDGVVRRAPLNR